MDQDKLAKWLKFIIIGVGVCGLIVYAVIVPWFGRGQIDAEPELAGWYIPWLIFISITGIPVYIALCFCWKVAVNIGNDRSFSMDNAKLLKWISWLAAADSAYFFIGNIVLMLLNMNHPGIVMLSLIVVFGGVAVTIASASLSHLIVKAADLQEQSDLTI